MQKGNYADADVYAGSMRHDTSHFALSFWQARPTARFGSNVKHSFRETFSTGISKALAAPKDNRWPNFVRQVHLLHIHLTCCIGLTMQEKRRLGTPNDTDATRTRRRQNHFRVPHANASRGQRIYSAMQI